ncbi:hypothetical protein QNH99_14365 [Pantoea allii]|uniref:F0F1-ATPase subunit (Ca2+/Mg2+ transporter) n=1 Tax=Pantoea allii TaxID=574096 RepID=A0ABS6VDB7_9GAMM|nr:MULTISPECIES: hypothetical protein [Pantoea]MBW1213672.1 hypothetical protein [Pantoea allii]MBW1257085.1 hypothetical protein [Pantoea allii]MBW1266162.1 hypothetical protein [Pantoea allii]MBW1288459.1 hypothetical protein [Pantoea allii]MDJ0038554.1 hypothetical protein [Pantoea allii]
MKNFLLAAISRIVQGIGIGICGLSLIYAGWYLFFSDNVYKYYLAVASLAGLVIGYYIFKFAVRKIYDESPGDW